jgi:hypothetical protein
VHRIGAPFAPIAASPVLEQAFVPNAWTIVAGVEQMLGLAPAAGLRAGDARHVT